MIRSIVLEKEGWAPKNCCFWAVILEKTLESPLESKVKPVNPKGNQSWIFIGRTDAEAEAPTLWPPDAKSWLIRKDPDAGTDWRWEEKGMIEEEMVGWHHWLDGHEFEQTLGDSEGQRSKLWEIVKDSWSAAVHGVIWSWTWLNDWTTKCIYKYMCNCVCVYKYICLYLCICIYIYLFSTSWDERNQCHGGKPTQHWIPASSLPGWHPSS